MLDAIVDGNDVLLPVKVVPGASRNRYLGEWAGRAKLTVAAPPERGKANRAVAELLAKLLGVSPRRITVTSGQTSPEKTVRIEGVTVEIVLAALR